MEREATPKRKDENEDSPAVKSMKMELGTLRAKVRESNKFRNNYNNNMFGGGQGNAFNDGFVNTNDSRNYNPQFGGGRGNNVDPRKPCFDFFAGRCMRNNWPLGQGITPTVGNRSENWTVTPWPIPFDPTNSQRLFVCNLVYISKFGYARL